MKNVFYLVLSLAIASIASALDVPELKSRVNDYAEIFQGNQIATLEKRLAEFENKTSNQLVILTIPTLKGETIEQFSIKVAEKWKIGQEKTDNGILLVVAVKDRKLRIEVGYGLEGALTDALSKTIIEDEIVPNFKKNDYVSGINSGVNAIMKATQNEYKPAKNQESASADQEPNLFWLKLLPFIIPLFIAAIFESIFGRIAGSITGGIISSILSYLLFGIFGAIICGLAGFLIGSFSKEFLDGLLSISNSGGGYSGGSSSGGRSSGSSGGFSGGGGSFGGGGASGSW